MPAISRGDALMRDATGAWYRRAKERGRKRRTAGRAVSSPAKDESLMRSQPRDYPGRFRGRLDNCVVGGHGCRGSPRAAGMSLHWRKGEELCIRQRHSRHGPYCVAIFLHFATLTPKCTYFEALRITLGYRSPLITAESLGNWIWHFSYSRTLSYGVDCNQYPKISLLFTRFTHRNKSIENIPCEIWTSFISDNAVHRRRFARIRGHERAQMQSLAFVVSLQQAYY